MKARKQQGTPSNPEDSTPSLSSKRQYLRNALEQKKGAQEAARMETYGLQALDVPEPPGVGQKRPASAGSDTLFMLYEGSALTDEQMDEMRNSGDFQELVNNLRNSDEWKKFEAGELETVDPMAEILVKAADPIEWQQMRSSGRYEEVLSMIHPPAHSISTVVEEAEPMRPAWESWLIKHGYVPATVGQTTARASLVGGISEPSLFGRSASIDFFSPTAADLANEEAIQFADSVLGPAELADAGCPMPELEGSNISFGSHRRHKPGKNDDASEQLLDMLRRQSLNSASDFQSTF